MIKKTTLALLIAASTLTHTVAADLDSLSVDKKKYMRQILEDGLLTQVTAEHNFIRTDLPISLAHWNSSPFLTPDEILANKKELIATFNQTQLERYKNILNTIAYYILHPVRHNPTISQHIFTQLMQRYPFVPNYLFIDGEIRHKDSVALVLPVPEILAILKEEEEKNEIPTLEIPVLEGEAMVADLVQSDGESDDEEQTVATQGKLKKKKKSFNLFKQIRRLGK